MDYYKLAPNKILEEFGSSINQGLTTEKITENKAKYGINKMEFSKKVTLLSLFIDQLKNPIVITLLITTVIAAIAGQVLEATLIAGIVLFMAGLGVYLENKAGDALEKLKKLTASHGIVVRNGKPEKVLAEEIVVGDIVLLHEGDKIPADCRLIEITDFKTNESILTGESHPITKNVDVIKDNVGIGDRKNMIYSSTYVVEGKAKAIVVAVGFNTEFGKIADKLSEIEDKPTPLQVQLDKLGKFLLISTLSICSLVLIVCVLRGQNIIESLVLSLSLAIAFIPEGLSAVMTVTLAIGVNEMVKKHVIIKRLIAAEGLGSISILATDKTGTITTGEMHVSKIWYFDEEIAVEAFRPTSKVEKLTLDIVKFCNSYKGATEVALVKFLEKLGLAFEIDTYLLEHRFSSEVKRMTVIKKHENAVVKGYSKGAPEMLIPLCNSYHDYVTDKVVKLDNKKRDEIINKSDEYAQKGYRVLCLAARDYDETHKVGTREIDENDLVFVALICLIDPLRIEVKDTVSQLRNAGVRAVMITGDHKEIAKTLALEAGIIHEKDTGKVVITGDELEEFLTNGKGLTENEILNCSVFARVSPDHKTKLIENYLKNDKIVAMAGDGINDAIAISKANIGIAISSGIDVVQEVADVVITGSYEALVKAVEIGRVIIQRTRLYLHYILSGNLCQVGVFLLALAFGYKEMPLGAISLLIINLLTDAAPAISMAFEKGEAQLMAAKPRKKDEGIITNQILISMIVQGVFTSIFLFAVFSYTLKYGIEFSQTATFTAYIFQKLFRAFTARSFIKSVFEYGMFSNKYTVMSVVFGFFVWFICVYVVGEYMKFASLPMSILVPIVLLSLLFPLLEEIIKYTFRKINKA